MMTDAQRIDWLAERLQRKTVTIYHERGWTDEWQIVSTHVPGRCFQVEARSLRAVIDSAAIAENAVPKKPASIARSE